MICKICNKNYNILGKHIKKIHNILPQEYYEKYITIGQCKLCGKKPAFKNMVVGFKQFCSVLCLNRFKAKDKVFLEKLSKSQKGKPRKKHNEITKAKCRLIMLNEWINNKQKRLSVIQSEKVRSKISKTISENGFKKIIGYLNNIRYESLTEKEFLNYCNKNNFNIKRFIFQNQKSIRTDNRWTVPDFILDDIIVVEVKDFHHWFKKELFNNMRKYISVQEWCSQNEYIYLFWFKKYGFISLDRLLKIKNKEDLNYFLEKYK